jgi:hypothetical protein
MTAHVVRMDHRRLIKEKSEIEMKGRRRMGRPKFRCLEDVEKNLRELKFKRWRQMAVDREEWTSVIKEAKALRGP